MNAKKYFIILLVVPFLIIGIGYGIVKILNVGIPQKPPIYVEVDRDIVFPWQPGALSTIHVDFTGCKKINKKLGKANIVLIIDNSGSMGDGIGSKFETARQVIGNFIDNFSGGQDTQMGVILFDSNVTHQIPLTNRYEELKRQLFGFTPSGGDTNFLPPLELAYQWLEPSIGTGKNNFIIFLTDGQSEADGPNQFYKDKLLANSVILFCIGVGEDAIYENLLDILRDGDGNVPSNRVLTCEDPIKLQFVYDQVGEEIGNVIGKQGRMPIPFASRAFAWLGPPQGVISPLKSGDRVFVLPPSDPGKVHFLTWPILFARDYAYHVPVRAKTFGIIKPFYDELPLRYYDIEGKELSLESGRIPYLLSVTWGVLFLLFLPFLLLLIAWWLLRKKPEAIPEFEPPLQMGETSKRPGVLPKQHIHERSQIRWIPTLILGLGRTGRHVLTHLKQNIDDLMSGDEKTIRLLAVDVAADEVFGSQPDRVPGVIVTLDKEKEIYVPEQHLRNVKDLVDQYKDNPQIDIHDPLTALDLKEYGRLPDSVLGLSGGTQRHAALARAYLVKELERDEQSALLRKLAENLRQLQVEARESGYMQIIIVGNSNGGVGSGLITDLAVLLRRLADRQLNNTIAVEINLCLVDDRGEYSEPGIVPIQNRVLLDELDCLSQAGRVYQPYPLVREKATDSSGVLKGIITRKPHNNVYVFARQTQEPQFDLYPEVADNLFFFIERTARIETRQFIEGIRHQEGEIRKNRKVESCSVMSGKAIMYPTRFIKEYLKILFIGDIFSDKIALKGLNAGAETLYIEPLGTAADLYDRPFTSRLFAQELGEKKTLWESILKGEAIAPFLDRPVEESEQFIYFLQKAFAVLLNEGVYSLTGLEQVIDELQRRCSEAFGRIQAVQPDTAPEIENVIAYLKAMQEQLRWWNRQLLGGEAGEGLVGRIRKTRSRLEETRQELLKMSGSRMVLGIDDKTPARYHFNGLREQWIAWWLNLPNTTDVYDRLKERCTWSVVPQDLLKPQVTFEFLGTHRHRFTPSQDLTVHMLAETEIIAGQFLVKLKDLTIMQLLIEYEREGTGKAYTAANVAQQFHRSTQSPNLYYLNLFPHHTRIRLSTEEEKYIRRLQDELEKIRYPYEILLYPASSNQYKIFSIQVAYLLQGNYKKPSEPFKPIHLPELLKKENHLTLSKKFDIACEKEIPYHYLVFYRREYFKTFTRLWLAGKIFQDAHDRLWKLESGGKKYRLTFMESETIVDAAVHFVLSDHLPFVAVKAAEVVPVVAQLSPTELKPDKKRQEQLEEEVRDNNTFYCWMKLYLEGGES
jgi:hypothetical protein